MLPEEAIQKVMDAYYHITGLRCYFVQDETEISGAKEKNFFCKCLKTSSSALRQCDECTFENYTGALKSINRKSMHVMLDLSNGVFPYRLQT